MTVEELISKIKQKSGLQEEEIKERINKKLEELKDLINEEGAAYLVAKDLGIELPSKRKQLKISDIMPGVRNVNFIGRVFKISKINEFERGQTKGRVVNLYVGDDTGFVRLPLWNDQVDYVKEGRLSPGSVIQVINGMSRENIYGDIEISLGRFGMIKIIDDTGELPSTDTLLSRFLGSVYERTNIKDITPGAFEIKATVVKVFKSNFIFENNTEKAIFLSVIVDDGTGDLRVTFFRSLAEKLLDADPDKLETMNENERQTYVEKKILGRELLIKGKVRKNVRFDRLEMIADDVKDLNALEESKKLLEEIEGG